MRHRKAEKPITPALPEVPAVAWLLLFIDHKGLHKPNVRPLSVQRPVWELREQGCRQQRKT